jgi:thiamine pyrophosphokinase
MAGETIILANGKFPEHEIPLGYLKNAEKIICCDGAARSLYKYGIEPYAIVGDIDSLKEAEIRKFHERLYKDADQETNDLTKAVKWCLDRDLTGIITGRSYNRKYFDSGRLCETYKSKNDN